MRKIKLIMLIMVIVSCKSVRVTHQDKTLASVVVEKLGEGAIVQKNREATFALCTRENLSTLSVLYIIIKLSDMRIVEEGTTARASFLWIDNYKIEVREIPGMLKKDDQPVQGKIIDVTKYMVKL